MILWILDKWWALTDPDYRAARARSKFAEKVARDAKRNAASLRAMGARLEAIRKEREACS